MKFKNKKYFFFMLGMALMDFLIFMFSFLIVYFFRFGQALPGQSLSLPSFFTPNFLRQQYYFGIYWRLCWLFSGLLLIVYYNFGLYRMKRGQEQLDEIFTVFKATALGALILIGFTFLVREISYSRFVIYTAGPLAFFLVGFWRTALWLLIGWLHKKGHGVNHLLIYGAGQAGQMLVRELKEHGEFGYKLMGFIDDDEGKVGQAIEGIKVLGTGHQLAQIVEDEKIDEIIIAFPSAERKKISQLVLKFSETKINLKIMPDLYDIITSRVVTEKIGNIPLLGLVEDPLKGWPVLVKRTLAVSISGLSLIVFSPLFLIVAVIIKLTSPGPVFFLQDRIGHNGQVFKMFKFRSMKIQAEQEREKLLHLNEAGGPIFKMKDDPRLTKIGKFLRRFSLDELPQLINVFLGQMSLVGPRPLPTYEVDLDDELQKKRLKVIPGMTGIWQVRGRSLLPYDEMVKLDIYYLENWSLWLDIKILLKTVWAVVGGRGAY